MAPSGPGGTNLRWSPLCEADLTKPDVIETAARDPKRPFAKPRAERPKWGQT